MSKNPDNVRFLFSNRVSHYSLFSLPVKYLVILNWLNINIILLKYSHSAAFLLLTKWQNSPLVFFLFSSHYIS